MEKRNIKTEINLGLVLKTSLESYADLKDFIEVTLSDTRIVYQRTTPRWHKIFIKEEGEGR